MGRVERALAVTGAALGLLVVVGGASLAVRSMLTAAQSDWLDDPWRLVIAGFGALPYVLALSATWGGTSRWLARCSLLATATAISFAVAFATGFSIGALFLLPTALLAAATVAALASRPEAASGSRLAPALAVGVAALWVLGVIALFVGPSSERCWRNVTYSDGRVERSTFEHQTGEPVGIAPPEPGVASTSVSCTNDVVTAFEGVTSGALLMASGALGFAVLRLGKARNESSTI